MSNSSISYAEKYMRMALQEACKASDQKEVPVGCVIVEQNQVLASTFNTMEQDCSVTSHAELKAIQLASKRKNNWRLTDCDLFVTMEPCNMCMGAILLCRIRSVYYGVHNPKTGAFTGPTPIPNQLTSVRIYSGICEQEIQEQLKTFFLPRRSEL